MSSKGAANFRKIVLKHWKENGRHSLPWRKTRDPYKILVSEIMLQQTQVDRVIPYYERFLKRFPSAKVLAAASLPEVLKLWSGLGYNRRGKYLHEAAKSVVNGFAGKFPHTYEDLRKLPGVGDYTARAVRTFAYNEPEAFIETNIRTAFTHHFFSKAKSVSDKELLQIIETVPSKDSREWYWALMDYGAYLKRSGVRINAKSKHYVKQAKFEGSLRQVRGAIIKAHLNKKELLAVKKRFAKQYDKALQALRKEGMLS